MSTIYVHSPDTGHETVLKFTSKTYETPFFSEISLVCKHYATGNNFYIVLKLIDWAVWKKNNSDILTHYYNKVVSR